MYNYTCSKKKNNILCGRILKLTLKRVNSDLEKKGYSKRGTKCVCLVERNGYTYLSAEGEKVQILQRSIQPSLGREQKKNGALLLYTHTSTHHKMLPFCSLSGIHVGIYMYIN